MWSIRIPALALALAATILTRSAPGAEDPGAGPLPLRLVVLDLTGDGLPEKLYLGEDAARVELNLGDGQYQPVAQELPGVRVHDVLATDLDGDGVLDAYLVGPGANHVWLGLGGGRFRDAANELGLDDAGFGLSAERLDVDGDGLQDLLLHNASGDVLFHARRVGARLAWNRDPDTPEIDAGQRLGTGLVGLALSLLGGALEPRDLPDDVEVHVGLDDHGRPALRLVGRPPMASEEATKAASLAPTLAGTPAPSPLMMVSPDAKYVNDNAGEVDSADIVDGSLTGADITTISGDVGVGTGSPKAKLHVAAKALPLGVATGRVVVSGDSNTTVKGDAELRLAASPTATTGMCLYYNGGQDLLPGVTVGESLNVYRTTDGGTNYDGPYLAVSGKTGDVGIGTGTPYADLHVAGDSNLGTILVTPADGQGSENFSQIRLAEDHAGMYGMKIFYDGVTNLLKIFGTNDGDKTAFGPHVTIARDTGLVGIETDAPDAPLGIKALPNWITLIRGLNEDDETVFRVFDDGRAGFGTDSPNAGLGVKEVPSTTTLFRAMKADGTTVTYITNTGRVVCNALQINGGGDLVEAFDSSAGELEPGTVVCVDPEQPGRVRPCAVAYDAKVVGAVSGANGVNHGIRMVQDGVLDGDTSVAMTGRVFVRCTAAGGPIRPGDRLTTSELCGHAMRAAADGPCDGAVLGKALSALDEGEGLVLVLVNLQ